MRTAYRVVGLLLAAGCGGGTRQSATTAPAAAPAAKAEAPAAPALDCAAICRTAASSSTLPPKSPCGPGRGELYGVVSAEDGKPLADAFVAAQSSCGLFYSTSRSDGSFTLTDLPQGPYLVAARSKGRLVEGRATVAGGASPASVDLRFGGGLGGGLAEGSSAAEWEKCDCDRQR